MTRTKKMVLAALFSALIAIGAFIQIPVPYMDYFTLQFFFVLMAGLLLGAKLGAVSAAVYVAVGLMGMPVFAAGGGLGYVLRPSFGYLLGFIAAAFVTGRIREKADKNGFFSCFAAALGGLVVCYAIGLTYKYWMVNFYAGEEAAFGALLLACFPLDLPGDLVLCAISAGLTPRLRKAMNKA